MDDLSFDNIRLDQAVSVEEFLRPVDIKGEFQTEPHHLVGGKPSQSQSML